MLTLSGNTNYECISIVCKEITSNLQGSETSKIIEYISNILSKRIATKVPGNQKIYEFSIPENRKMHDCHFIMM